MQWMFIVSIMYNYCKSYAYKVRWIDTLKSSLNGHYSERFKELELAIHTLSNNNQRFGKDYILNNGNHNKKFVLSIMKFLKEIGWLVQDENGKISIVTWQIFKNVKRDDISPRQKKIEVILELHIYENRKDVILNITLK